MENHDVKILKAIMDITHISNQPRIALGKKLNRILMIIIECMNTKAGSIMLKKGKNNLEVVASTNSELIGVKQAIDDSSCSSWVVKNKKPLYSKDPDAKNFFVNNFKRYKKDAFFIAPIFNQNKIIGVLNVTEKMGSDLFSQTEREMLLTISGHLIGAIENNRLTQSLRKKQIALSKKNIQLKNLEKLRSELFNMLIHDLKGPISEVVANLDILSYTIVDENREYVSAAQTGCDTLYRMIIDLLDISRLEEGRIKLVLEKMKPSDLVNEAVSRIHAQAKISNTQISTEYPEKKPEIMIECDRNLLNRVIQNLLINAIKYSPKAGFIQVGFEYTDKGKVMFYVKDRGPGIPEKYHEAIFNKYFKLANKNEAGTYSTGLGLAFCKLSVNAHKGNIFVESNGTQGSCFKFTVNTVQEGI